MEKNIKTLRTFALIAMSAVALAFVCLGLMIYAVVSRFQYEPLPCDTNYPHPEVCVAEFHHYNTAQLAFSPTGDMLATFSTDDSNPLQLWRFDGQGVERQPIIMPSTFFRAEICFSTHQRYNIPCLCPLIITLQGEEYLWTAYMLCSWCVRFKSES